MTDIVERLHKAEDMNEGRGCGLFKEAAAEITRLRATIDQLRSVAGAVSLEMPLLGDGHGRTFSDIKRQAAHPVGAGLGKYSDG